MKIKKSLLATLTLAVAVLAIPATASAGVYCVGPGTYCAPDPPYPQTPAGITAAVNAAVANPGFDSLRIAAGTYEIDSNTFPALPATSDGLWMSGAGAGQTIFNGEADGINPALNLELPNDNSMLNGITLNVNFTSNFAFGVLLKRGQLNEFEINQTGTVSNGAPASAIGLSDGTRIYRGTVSSSGNASGVSLLDGQTYVQNISLTGAGTGSGVFVSGDADTSMNSLRIVGYATGLRINKGSVEFTDSLIDMQDSDSAIGLLVNDQDASQASNIYVEAARNTIIGTGSSTGIYVYVQEAGDTSSGSYDDMLIYGTDPSFSSWLCTGTSGSGPDFDFKGLASNVPADFSVSCEATELAPAPIALTESPFVNFAARSLRPTWDAPIVDAGTTTPLAWANDLDDGSHRVDGDNDGVVINDIGAFEYQADPPTGSISAPSTAAVGQTLTFSHSMADSDPTNLITGVVWNFGDGATSTLNSPTHAYAAAGDYTVSVTATNLAGSVGTATARVVIPVVPVNRPDAAPPTAKIASKPKKSFTIGKSSFALVKKGATTFSVTFTGATKAKFTLQSIGKKRKLTTVKGSQTLKLPTSSKAVKFSFGGKWNKKTLAAGSYRVTITPVSAAGISGKPATVNLKLSTT